MTTFTIQDRTMLAQRLDAGVIALKDLYTWVSNKRLTMRAAKLQITILIDEKQIGTGSAMAFANSALKCRTIKSFLAAIDCCQLDTLAASRLHWSLVKQFKREQETIKNINPVTDNRKVENPIKRHNHTIALGIIKLALAFDKYAIIDPLAWSATIREIRELTCYGMVQDSDRAVTRAEHYAILNRIQDSIIKELEYLK